MRKSHLSQIRNKQRIAASLSYIRRFRNRRCGNRVITQRSGDAMAESEVHFILGSISVVILHVGVDFFGFGDGHDLILGVGGFPRPVMVYE